jgi:hypothetical protein
MGHSNGAVLLACKWMTRLTFQSLFLRLSDSKFFNFSCSISLIWSGLLHSFHIPSLSRPAQPRPAGCSELRGRVGWKGWRCKVQGGWPFFLAMTADPPLPLQSNRLPQRSGSSSSRSVFLQGSPQGPSNALHPSTDLDTSGFHPSAIQAHLLRPSRSARLPMPPPSSIVSRQTGRSAELD